MTKKSFGKLSKEHPTLDEYLNDELHKESQFDRATAITSSAFVEDALERTLLARFVKLEPKEKSALFDYERPLGSFSAQIHVGYAISLFGPKTRNDLDTMREIRNVFAHGRRFLTFREPKIKGKCLALKAPDHFSMGGLGRAAYREYPPTTPRERFTATAQVIIEQLNGELHRIDATLPKPLKLP